MSWAIFSLESTAGPRVQTIFVRRFMCLARLPKSGYLPVQMRYFVIGEDGQLYGPADIPTLNQWIAEGRLRPTTMIMEELGGARFAASMLKELNFPSTYPRDFLPASMLPGENEVKTAWIMGAIGLLCCSFFAPIGLVYAIVGKSKGHPRAVGAIVFCTFVILVSIAWIYYYFNNGRLEGILRGMR